MNSDKRTVLFGIGKRTERSHAERVRDHQLFECCERGGRVPSETNSVIKAVARYPYVLNGDDSVSMSCLLSIAKKIFKITIIPEHIYMNIHNSSTS